MTVSGVRTRILLFPGGGDGDGTDSSGIEDPYFPFTTVDIEKSRTVRGTDDEGRGAGRLGERELLKDRRTESRSHVS